MGDKLLPLRVIRGDMVQTKNKRSWYLFKWFSVLSVDAVKTRWKVIDSRSRGWERVCTEIQMMTSSPQESYACGKCLRKWKHSLSIREDRPRGGGEERQSGTGAMLAQLGLEADQWTENEMDEWTGKPETVDRTSWWNWCSEFNRGRTLNVDAPSSSSSQNLCCLHWRRLYFKMHRVISVAYVYLYIWI